MPVDVTHHAVQVQVAPRRVVDDRRGEVWDLVALFRAKGRRISNRRQVEDLSLWVLGRHRPGQAVAEVEGVADLRLAGNAGRLRAAEVQGLRLGRSVAEERQRLTREERTQGAVRLAQPEAGGVRVDLETVRVAEPVGVREVALDEGLELAVGRGGARLDVEARLRRRHLRGAVDVVRAIRVEAKEIA